MDFKGPCPHFPFDTYLFGHIFILFFLKKAVLFERICDGVLPPSLISRLASDLSMKIQVHRKFPPFTIKEGMQH